jgi:AraC-like DNA-binding protein
VDPRIRILLRIIEERHGKGLSTFQETSRLLGISEAYLRRLFHREVGTSFRCYLLGRKMVRAAQLLNNGTLSIKGIAFDSGYDDISNFYRDFKKVHGRSPRQLRGELLQLRLQQQSSSLGDWISSMASMH